MSGAFEPPPGLSATLVLVRHGESTFIAEGRFQGRQDPPLSPLGERQVSLVAARLAAREADVPLPIPAGPARYVWHSPLRRAADTATAIAASQAGPAEVQPRPDLIELGQGEWEGLPHAQVHARWATELARWRMRPTEAQAPGGEPLLEAAARVRRALGEMSTSLAGETNAGAATGTSDTAGDAASVARSPVPGYPTAATAGEPAEPWAVIVAHDGIFRLLLMTLLGVPYERFWSFPFSLCAISVVGLRDGVAALRAHNLADHLAPLAADARAAAEASGDRRGAL